jgi:hypothetical protein
MKRFLRFTVAAGALTGIMAIGFTPAEAIVTKPNLKPDMGSVVTSVHCKKKFHCHWIKQGLWKRTKHCHVCGQFRD